MRVAIQGTHGSFSEAAARWRWKDGDIVPCRDVQQVVAAVREGRAEAGCLAIENSLFGSVTATYDLLHEAFGDGALHLSDEILLPVFHSLLALPGAELSGIRRVLSHPVALGQCRIWLDSHLPHAELVSEWDTAGSAEIVARDGRKDQAAVAPLGAGGAYGLNALAERIEDDPSNQTRFLTFTREAAPAPAAGDAPVRRKTSLLLWLPHKPGMLAAALQAFASRGVNLTSLQSRPERTAPWTYRFYVDVEGAPDEPRLAEAMEATEALVTKVVVLGSYREWNDGTAPSRPPMPAPAHHRPRPDFPLYDRRQKPEGTRFSVRGVEIGGDRPVLIAGPCSVEGEEMLLEAAVSVAASGADMLRGGAYKPRTSPYEFQGLGVRGLKFLAEAREKTGLPVVTEVLSWEEVPVVSQYADVLQIGARNMQNFALLRAAGRSGKPILLKRGGGATIEEWLSAAEYILADGNEQVILCERGIRTFERATRHTLDLNGVALVRERTHLPVLVDPSHAAGIRSIVAPLALAGLAAGAHGVLVEVHPHPEAALSDGAQSLDLAGFAGAGADGAGRLAVDRAADRLGSCEERAHGVGVALAQRGREPAELRGDRVDRAGEGFRIGERELEREGHGLARQARGVEQARPGQSREVVARCGARGLRERAGDGVGQVTDPAHQAVVPLRVELDGARADRRRRARRPRRWRPRRCRAVRTSTHGRPRKISGAAASMPRRRAPAIGCPATQRVPGRSAAIASTIGFFRDAVSVSTASGARADNTRSSSGVSAVGTAVTTISAPATAASSESAASIPRARARARTSGSRS